MTSRSPTENENGGPLHVMLSLQSVIPAHAAIQVCSSRISLDTRFRGYDGPRQPLFVLISGQLFSKEVTKNTKFDSISIQTLRVLRALRGEGEVPQFRSHGEITYAEP
jgi:hypothetical protein